MLRIANVEFRIEIYQMILKNNIYKFVSFHLFVIRYSIDKDFCKINKRYMYNVKNYIKIENEKTCFIQCFLYQYRDIKYDFFIINIV